jgi:diketogulonate reductase-like aldo/keto reductase
MEWRRFGPTRREVAVVGQGTWYGEAGGDRAAAVAALRRGLDLGMTHVDTAEMYGDGEAEEWVGEAIAGRRDEVFLVSKVLPSNASRAGTVRACERSLARLGVERLDGYLLHWRGPHPLAETVEAFGRLVRQGKILSWGVSNFDADDLDELWQVSGGDQVACNQVLYYLQERAVEHAVVPWCERHGVAVVAYSPYGRGRFPKPGSPGGRVLEEVARAHGATARQAALRFLLRTPGLFAIPQTTDPGHAAENAGAGALVLSDDELARIDAAFPRGPEPRELPVL